MNDAIAAFANEQWNIIQLDYEGIKDDTGAIKSTLTTNGHRLKDAASVQIYYNAMKEAIKNKRIGGISKKTAVNNIDTNTVHIVANTNHVYNSGVCTSYKFEIPSYTTLDYWSRITFSTATRGEPTKFTQPDNVWLEGNDCKEGALIPKAATTYVINLYACSYSDDYYGTPYFGTVSSTTDDGSYNEFETFVGGKELARIAETYYTNRNKLTWIAWNKTPCNFSNPEANRSQWTSGGKMGIMTQCLTKLCSMGIEYDNSPYAKEITKLSRNTLQSWSWDVGLDWYNQAKYAVQNGWALNDVDLTNFSNLKPGDFIYYSTSSSSNYMSITQIAIYVGNKQAISVDNKIGGTVIKYTLDSSNVVGTPSQIVMVARPRKE